MMGKRSSPHVSTALLLALLLTSFALSSGLKPTHVKIPWFLGVTKTAASAKLAVGSKVSWVWKDKLPHSIQDLNTKRHLFTGVGAQNSFKKAPFVYNHTFTKVGQYAYDCGIHGPAMTGTITIVKAT
eukprot:TRINITY_DN29587_c0_g1_i1.p2 TRINITY_DN29587_c0_g1~~TRINITY_DN29587_c0_g1_i1.p2  ORF type:complete len:127 (+),score=10.04 TRINITY_DN29587_c0_g1_i1:410-790(+)